MNMPKLIILHNTLEENGKTIRENNLQKKHNIPLGTLVEVKYTNWHGDGACEKVHARLWIVECGRDCDGTPLYWLSTTPVEDQRWIESINGISCTGIEYTTPTDMARRMFYKWQGGFREDSLTVVEDSEKLNDLEWEDGE